MESILITLNSKDAEKRNGDYNSNLYFDMPNVVPRSLDIDYIDCSLEDATIPVSWYLINDTNNTLHYNYNSINDSIVLTNGNYTGSTLITEMSTKFLDKGITMTIVLSTVTGKLTFRISSAITEMTLIYASSPILMDILGFTQSITGFAFTGEKPLNLLGIQKLNICSFALANVSSFSSSKLANTIVQTLPIDMPSFHQITYQNKTSHYGKLKSKYISGIDIQLLDENGNFVEMNGISYNLSLMVRVFRKKEFDSTINPVYEKTEPLAKEEDNKKEEKKEDEDEDEGDDDLNILTAK